jgi:hypothetical protein
MQSKFVTAYGGLLYFTNQLILEGTRIIHKNLTKIVYECSSSNNIVNYFHRYTLIFFQNLSARKNNKFNLGLVSKIPCITYVLVFFLVSQLALYREESKLS